MSDDKYHIYRVKRVVKVVDGDTIDCEVDVGFHLCITERFRLLDVDAPEVRGHEKVAGKAVTADLKELLGRVVELRVRSRKQGNFRRWLGIFECKLETDGEWMNLNDWVAEKSREAVSVYLEKKDTVTEV